MKWKPVTLPWWRVLESYRWGPFIQLAWLNSGWTGTVPISLPAPSGKALWNPSVSSCMCTWIRKSSLSQNTLCVLHHLLSSNKTEVLVDDIFGTTSHILLLYIHSSNCVHVDVVIVNRVSGLNNKSFHVNNSVTNRIITTETITHLPWSWRGTGYKSTSMHSW